MASVLSDGRPWVSLNLQRQRGLGAGLSGFAVLAWPEHHWDREWGVRWNYNEASAWDLEEELVSGCLVLEVEGVDWLLSHLELPQIPVSTRWQQCSDCLPEGCTGRFAGVGIHCTQNCFSGLGRGGVAHLGTYPWCSSMYLILVRQSSLLMLLISNLLFFFPEMNSAKRLRAMPATGPLYHDSLWKIGA